MNMCHNINVYIYIHHIYISIYIYTCGGFLNRGSTPKSSIYRYNFPFNPFVLGYHHLWQPRYRYLLTCIYIHTYHHLHTCINMLNKRTHETLYIIKHLSRCVASILSAYRRWTSPCIEETCWIWDIRSWPWTAWWPWQHV